MLSHRLQILLDDGRFRRLSREADRRRTSVAAIIRAAIDDALPQQGDTRRRSAIDSILAAEPMTLPRDPSELRKETAAARLRSLR